MDNLEEKENTCMNKEAICFGQNKIVKVLFFEACFDLIWESSLSMKIQILGGKNTETLGFKSPLRKVKIFCPFFFSSSNSSTKVDIFF